jgi:cyclohexanone monooxygenase
MITSGEWQVDFVTQFIDDMNKTGKQRVDTTERAEENWHREVDVAAANTLYATSNSWYTGANIPGKPRSFMIYTGGFDRYRRRCEEQVQAGYAGFVFEPTTTGRSNS